MEDWAGRLADTGLSRSLRESFWLYPCIEVAHILGFIVLVGAIMMFDVRLLGAARRLPVSALGAHLRKWSFGSLVLVVPTGLLLFTAQPVELVKNPVFGLKLLTIGAAALNALAFRLGVHRSVHAWDREVPAPRAARFHAMASLLLWCATVTCGRFLAYT